MNSVLTEQHPCKAVVLLSHLAEFDCKSPRGFLLHIRLQLPEEERSEIGVFVECLKLRHIINFRRFFPIFVKLLTTLRDKLRCIFCNVNEHCDTFGCRRFET